MAIQKRGRSYRVKIFNKGQLVAAQSFTDEGEAKAWEKQEKARLVLGDIGPSPQGKEMRALGRAKWAAMRKVEDEWNFSVPLARALGRSPGRTVIAPESASESVKPSGPTVADLIARYKAEVTPSKGGWQTEMLRLDVFAKHPLAKRVVTTLAKDDFRKWQRHRVNVDGVANDTVTRELAIWKHIFSVARDQWHVSMPRDHDGNSINPAAVKSLPADEARDIRLLPAEEECLLRHAAADALGWFHLPIMLMLEINLRRGELLKARRAAINWDRKELKLPAAVVKNRKPRIVPLTSRSMTILRTAVEVIPADSLGRIFPFDGPAFTMRFQRVRKAAVKEMPSLAKFRLHDTRHEAISRMASKIKNAVVLARATGHKDVKTLLRYVNPTPDELAGMME